MCAAAGVPLLPSDFPPSDYGEGIALSENSEINYQDLLSNDGSLLFDEADDEQVLPVSRGLPLKERLLELVCGEDTQLMRYHDVMEYWTSSDDCVMPDEPMQPPDRKRVFDLFLREAESESDGGRPATEDGRSKRRLRPQWNRFGMVAPALDTESE